MSHHALQRALVIALHDDGFVAAMHADPDAVLAPLGLTARERAQLLAVDRRAFRTDPLRRRRLLRTLAEELQASTTLALWETRSAAFVEGFFGSPFFHQAVAQRAPLAPAFGDFLAAAPLATPQLADVVRLETLRARCRRDRHRAAHPGTALAPGVAVASFDAAVLETVHRVERYLFELGLMPQLALCSDGPALPELPALGDGTLFLLFAPAAGGISLTPIDGQLHRVLAAFATPRDDPAAAPHGVPRARVPGLVSRLVEEGLVTSATPRG